MEQVESKLTPPTHPFSAKPKRVMPKSRKIALSIIGGCLVLLIIGGVTAFFLVRKTAKKVSEEIERSLKETQGWRKEWTEIAKEIEKDIESERGQIGSTLTDGYVAITLNSVKELTKVDKIKPAKENRFINVNVTLENKTDDDIMVYSSFFVISDAKSNEYGQVYLVKKNLEHLIKDSQNIPAEGKISGDIIFEVKKEAKELKLIYKGERKLTFDLELNK